MPAVRSPFRILLILAASIFISEVLVMGVIFLLPPFPSELIEALFDSSLLIMMLSPALYLFLFKPLLTNIREREAAEEKVQKLNRELERRVFELEELNRELESFSYSVSHDLRSPLIAIEGFGKALAEDYSDSLDDKGKDHLERILSSSKRMSQIIESLLNLSRVARTEICYEEVDLSDMARAISVELSQRFPDSRVELSVEKGIKASGDAKLLRTVMENLLGNAWKYTSKQPNPRVDFGMKPDEDGKKVYFVRDNGAGFNMNHADKLFAAFERLHSVEEYPGTGIGLATVQRIIHRHGGRIWAEGEVGKGAVFYFTVG